MPVCVHTRVCVYACVCKCAYDERDAKLLCHLYSKLGRGLDVNLMERMPPLL